MSITIEGIKKVFSSIWKSLPSEVVLVLMVLVGMSQLDFLPLPVLISLASLTSIVSFGMLFVKMYNKSAHDWVISKAVRLAEKNYIQTCYSDCRPEYISHIKESDKTIMDTVKDITSELTENKQSDTININISKDELEEPEPETDKPVVIFP